MCDNKRSITINVLPTSPAAWFCIAAATAFVAMSSCAIKETHEIQETERVKAQSK